MRDRAVFEKLPRAPARISRGPGAVAALVAAGFAALALPGPGALAQDPTPPPDSAPGAAAAEPAPRDVQTPPTIGIIDYYGLETITPARVEALLPFRLGDGPVDAAELARAGRRIAGGLGVPSASVELVCCEDGRLVAYVGVEDRPFSHPAYRPDPEGVIELPDSVLADAERFEQAVGDAAASGADLSEDWSEGHSLATASPEIRAIQEGFVEYAAGHVRPLRRVLAESRNARHRAIAALMLGYAPDKAAIVPDLEAAVLDSDPGVRNNATRALALIALYAGQHPELGIAIDPAPFIEMLNSGSWTDRNKGLAVLGMLTAAGDQTNDPIGDPAVIERLKSAEILPALIEMCRWQAPGHSLVACKLLERVVGLPRQTELHPKEQTLALAAKLR